MLWCHVQNHSPPKKKTNREEKKFHNFSLGVGIRVGVLGGIVSIQIFFSCASCNLTSNLYLLNRSIFNYKLFYPYCTGEILSPFEKELSPFQKNEISQSVFNKQSHLSILIPV